jgi:HEAT repeat protein
MCNYPFDNEFIETLNRLFDDDAYWVITRLIDGGSEYLDRLSEAGYSEVTVKALINELTNMPLNSLFSLAVRDLDKLSPALIVLQNRRSRDVFEGAIELTLSNSPEKRAVGVEIIMRSPGIQFREEAQERVRKMAEMETSDRVLESLAYALSHLDVPERARFLVQWANSQSAETRFAVACSMGLVCNNAAAVECLVALSQDVDEDVRDWATFGLGAQAELDMPEIRDALFRRLSDPHDATRHEAIFGLAKRHDARVIDALKRALEGDDVWELAVDAAKELRGTPLYSHVCDSLERFLNESKGDV